MLFVARGVNTERLVHTTETRHGVEPESKRPNESKQASLALPFFERTNCDNGQQGGE